MPKSAPRNVMASDGEYIYLQEFGSSLNIFVHVSPRCDLKDKKWTGCIYCKIVIWQQFDLSELEIHLHPILRCFCISFAYVKLTSVSITRCGLVKEKIMII